MIEKLFLATPSPDLDIALNGELTDSGQDVKRILDEFIVAEVYMPVYLFMSLLTSEMTSAKNISDISVMLVQDFIS